MIRSMTNILRSPKLEDLLRDAIRSRDYSLATERQYVHWSRAYVRFHKKQHPQRLGP